MTTKIPKIDLMMMCVKVLLYPLSHRTKTNVSRTVTKEFLRTMTEVTCTSLPS